MKNRIKYLIDSENRLNSLLVDAKGQISGPHRVYEGEWGLEKGGNLVYRLRERGIPTKEREIRFSGNWSLTSEHALRLALDGKENGLAGDELNLAGAIVVVEANEIGFAVATRGKEGRTAIRVLRLGGRWQADEENRLSFFVERGGGKQDRLTFGGAWEIGKNHEIIYRYETFDQAKKQKIQQSFSLRGRWEITDRRHLSYRMDRIGRSVLQFRVAIESPTLQAKEGMIRYQLGLGVTHARNRGQAPISLFGKWKLGRKFGIGFAMEYENGRRQTLQFDTDYHINRDRTITFSLKNSRGERLGFAVTFTQDLLSKSGQAFLRLRRKGEESAVETGISFPF